MLLLADWLTAQGYLIKADELQNVKQSALVEGMLPCLGAGRCMAGHVRRQRVSTKSALCHPRTGKYDAGSSVLQVTATADKHLPSEPMKELQNG